MWWGRLVLLFWTAGSALGWNPEALLPLEEDCWNTFRFNDVVCPVNHTLYRTTNIDKSDKSKTVSTSCAYCTCSNASSVQKEWGLPPVCCPGWNGTECDICVDVEACPAVTVNGTRYEAIDCTNHNLAPINTYELNVGKKFSCSCGGGEDSLSDEVCLKQGYFQNGVPSTRMDFTVYGDSDNNQYSIKVREIAGYHGATWDKIPGEYNYSYAVVWEGDLTGCTITEGKCMNVIGTDVSSKDCFNYKCSNTEVYCPPRGHPACPGGMNDCDIIDPSVDPDKPYQVHKCNVIPANGVEFDVSCLKETNDGFSHVCYYNQGNAGYAPMSVTCTTGTCMYNFSQSASINYGTSTLTPPLGLSWQRKVLYISAGVSLGTILLFFLIGRWLEQRQKAHFILALAAKSGKPAKISQATTNPLLEPLVVGTPDIRASSGAGIDQGAVGIVADPTTPLALATTSVDARPLTPSAVASTERLSVELAWRHLCLWVPVPMSDKLKQLRAAVVTKSVTSGPAEQAAEHDKLVDNPLDEQDGGGARGEKQILHRVSGLAGASGPGVTRGGITALMGPSGAGKTSLLDCLAARKYMHRVSGQVTVDGVECSPGHLRSISGFVAQSDVLPGVLTVSEHLLFHARLRCTKLDAQGKRMRVHKVIGDLGLRKCQDTVIGNEFKRGLSGGEKRRVSVAEELLVFPSILFMDEPTTGLDSSTALSLIRTVADIAKHGTTVLMSIHQPREDIFDFFDRVLLLKEGGHVVFEGPAELVRPFIAKAASLDLCKPMPSQETHSGVSINPADVLLDIASHPKSQAVADQVAMTGMSTYLGVLPDPFDKKHASARDEINGARRSDAAGSTWSRAFFPTDRAGPHVQFMVLANRLVVTALRHPMLLSLQYLGSLFLAVALGFIFRNAEDDLYGVQDRFGVLFFIPFCLVLLGMSSLPVWRDEHVLFSHEHANKQLYGFTPYFFAVIFFDLVLVRAIPPLSFALISYKMIGLNPYCDDCLIIFAIILILTNVISALVSMTIGAFRFSTSLSNLIGAIVALLFALFGGFLVNKHQMKASGARFYVVDPLAYSYEALLINQFGNEVDAEGSPYYYTINGSWCAKGLPVVYPTGNELLSTFSFSNSQTDMDDDINALWMGAVLCAVGAFLVLLASSSAAYLSAAMSAACPGWTRLSERCHLAALSLLNKCFGVGDLDAPGDADDDDGDEDDIRYQEQEEGGGAEAHAAADGDHEQAEAGLRSVLARNRQPLPGRKRTASTEHHAPRESHSRSRNSTYDSSDSDRGYSYSTELVEGGLDVAMEGDIVQHGHCIPRSDVLALAESLADFVRVKAPGARLRPSILSFHDIRLSVPQPGLGRLGVDMNAVRATWSEQEPGSTDQPGGEEEEEKDESREQITLKFRSPHMLGMRVNQQASNGATLVEEVAKGSPAEHLGVAPGDRIVAIAGEPCEQLEAASRLSTVGRPVSITFLRAKRTSAHRLQGRAGETGHETGEERGWLRVLRGVSGVTLSEAPSTNHHGSATATVAGIMGPSGAGKTSLLDVLAGRKTVGKVQGSVRVNGKSVTPAEMRSISGYVMQEDILPVVLTVRECLQFHARLRLPPRKTRRSTERRNARRIDAVLEALKLTRSQDTIIGGAFRRGISGGEKRRVSVAVEMLSRPAILFLDEATTGLDSSTAAQLVATLKTLSQVGTTVVMSIHQPRLDIYRSLTQVIFLTKDGRLAYCGPPTQTSAYLEGEVGVVMDPISRKKNPADLFMDEMQRRAPPSFETKFMSSPAGRVALTMQAAAKVLHAPRSRAQVGKFRPAWSTQFMVLSQRCMRGLVRNWFQLILNGLMAIVTAAVLGSVFKDVYHKDDETAGIQDRFGIMFFLVLYLSLLSLSSLPLWRDEQALFVVERGSGIYSTAIYVTTTIMFDVLPYRTLAPLAFTAIAYPMIGLQGSTYHQWRFFLILLVTNLTNSGLCMLVGLAASSNASANAAGSLVMLISLLFCGFLLNSDRVPEYFTWLQTWAPGNYAYESLVVNEFVGLQELYVTSIIGEEKVTAGPFTGEQIAHCFAFVDQVNLDIIILAIMAGGYFVLIFLVMLFFIREKR